MSEMRPTARGPMNDADLSVSANREKKDDSWSCYSAWTSGDTKLYVPVV
jgi:hypothetical protein